MHIYIYIVKNSITCILILSEDFQDNVFSPLSNYRGCFTKYHFIKTQQSYLEIIF